MNAINEIPLLLENEAATLDEEGWALIAPFGEHPKSRLVKKNGRLMEEKFIQVLDNESADRLLSQSRRKSSGRLTESGKRGGASRRISC
jgi:hypothetical protein